MVKLEVIQGGLEEEDFPITKPAQTPPGEDWLRKLPNHTRFLCQHKTNKGSLLDNFGVAAILPEAVMVYDFQTAMGNPFKFVLSEIFSRDNRLVAILPEQEGDNNAVQRDQPADELRSADDGPQGEH